MSNNISYEDVIKESYVIKMNVKFIITNMRIDYRFTLTIPSESKEWSRLCSIRYIGFNDDILSTGYDFKNCRFNNVPFQHHMEFPFDIKLNILENNYGYQCAELIKM